MSDGGLGEREGSRAGPGRARSRILPRRPAGPLAGGTRRSRGLERARAARACPAQRARPAPRFRGREGPRAGPRVPGQRLPAASVPTPALVPAVPWGGRSRRAGVPPPFPLGTGAAEAHRGRARGSRAPQAGSVPREFPPAERAAKPREFSYDLCVLWEPLPVHLLLASGRTDHVSYFCFCITIKNWSSLFFVVAEGG